MNQPIRLSSADVYRGFVMLLMMAEVLHFQKVSEALPDSSFWKFMAFHQDHVEWIGCSLHDLIQPSFSFLVGVVLPFSILNRKNKGEPFGKLVRHAAWRSLILIVLGIFLRSQYGRMTYFTFEDTLSQIGLGYTFLFILGFQSFRTQVIAFIVVVVGYWAAFILYPIPTNFDYTAVNASNETILNGFTAHWNKNSNLAWAFDTWFLNLFPRENPFLFNGGGYATLSFIPTLGTMILGLFAGQILISDKPQNDKIKQFILLGIGGLMLGFILNYTGICPNVKRIWTPTWVIYSGGWCFLLMALFYYLIDIKNQNKWFVWLMIIGMNSIAAYIIAHTVDSYISKALHTHLGENYDTLFGISYRTLVHGGLILFFEWLILRWMYKKKIFIRI
jgi:predicted acyltransferase